MPHAGRAAALLEREELLTAQSRHVTDASYRLRCEIEEELAEINRLLVALGLRTDSYELTPGSVLERRAVLRDAAGAPRAPVGEAAPP